MSLVNLATGLTVALTVTLTMALTLALLSETNRISTTLNSAARYLTDTSDGVSGALQGLAEEANNVRHFY